MCLSIIPNFTRKNLYGYKVIKQGIPKSPCEGFVWNTGENISSRKKTKLTYEEKFEEIVLKGFHIFISLRAARNYYIKNDGEKIIKVYYKKEDIVAYGYSSVRLGKRLNVNSVVVTKCTVKSFRNFA